ncbi:hypothetical protein GLUCOINTEAF2_0201941 [Komagataeibacter intermedius AF2]|uniref:Uncharacterized protein n=1 Tax=Komagataeibacter intermedius AF2 TaxID=1458464 RepID=A0A0N1FA75_9PROT|nr:hypothetical protein GLUCOINTEAF2_0201941 [Komagataeibacter intermedius AF2]
MEMPIWRYGGHNGTWPLSHCTYGPSMIQLTGSIRLAYGHFSRAGVLVPGLMQALPRDPDFLDMQVPVQNDKIGPPPDREFPPV